MNRSRIAPMGLALAALSAQAADIVLTPPGGGAVTITNSGATQTRFRIVDDGTVTMNGNLFKGAEWFLHNFGVNNTFLGLSAGNLSMTGDLNTAMGRNALGANTSGPRNTVVGANALRVNTLGGDNVALGTDALTQNTSGSGNAALGVSNLRSNLAGNANLAAGYAVMFNNTNGSFNTGLGFAALDANTTGDSNVAVGSGAMSRNVIGRDNIAVGYNAGTFTTGNFNVLLGHEGVAGESNAIRLGQPGAQNKTFIAGIRGTTVGGGIAVMIDSAGQLGTVSSSARFKDDIAVMGDATSGLMKLRPVTFHYLADQDPAGRTLQYGLVAEEVAEVYPGLVARSPDGQVETVMYQFLPSMLLNEVQKQHRVNEAQSVELAVLRRELAEMKQMLRRQP